MRKGKPKKERDRRCAPVSPLLTYIFFRGKEDASAAHLGVEGAQPLRRAKREIKYKYKKQGHCACNAPVCIYGNTAKNLTAYLHHQLCAVLP